MQKFFKFSPIIMIILTSLLVLSGCTTPSSVEKTTTVKNSINENKSGVDNSSIKNTKSPNSENNQQEDNKKVMKAVVTDNIDGDTIKVKFENNKEETIRLLLIDTPETVHPSKPVEPFGKEASDYAKELMPINKDVEVELDVSERDKYGRLLAYIWVDGKMYNELVIEKGLARVAYVYAPNTKYVDLLREKQSIAQQQAIGIWSIENYATDSGFNTEAASNEKQNEVIAPTTKPSKENNACTIKGNINSKGEKIYHVEGGQFYEKTDAEEMFCSEKEAENAGFRKSKR